ncbi:hypothetical protein [Haloferula sp.]|uniref:hypothetical protein n=1 Tax=Haloferula sp. TaxID=2497595 RepID=UPI003C78453B
MLHRLFLLLLVPPVFAIPASTTLTLVEGEPGFNTLTIRVDPDTPISLADTETTILSGSVIADFDVDPATGKTSEFTLREGRATTSPLNFSRSFLGLGYNVSGNQLSAAIVTPDPPGTVEPETGEFDASQHSFEIDQGSITGTALGSPVDLTLSPEDPFIGSGSGTGTITLTPDGNSGIFLKFSVAVTLPIAIDDNFDGGGVNVAITAAGTLKATGTLEVPKSEYLAWTLAEGITGADGQADANGDGVPNAIVWALGLGALDDARNFVLKTANGAYEIQLPPTGTIAPITIQGSDLFSAWTPVSANRISSSLNPIPPASTGLITISRIADEFLRLKVDE